MKLSGAWIFGLIFTSFFIGCVVIALPISLIPKLTESLTAKLLCQPGTFQVRTRDSDDGHHYTNYSCLDRNGASQDITFQALAVPGLISAGAIFVVMLVAGIIGRLTSTQAPPSPSTDVLRPAPVSAPIPASPSFASPQSSRSESRTERLKELKDMYDSNLISAEDYERKKNEILDQV